MQRIKAKSLEPRAAMSLSRSWKRQDKREQARQIMSETYGWFTKDFDTTDVKKTKVLFEELSD